MGYLLSCRQGYAEGIHTLYSANCINIVSQPLLIHIPRLIPPNRLGSITSLEITVIAERVEQDVITSPFTLDHI